MANRNNDVFSVLVPTNNIALLAAGNSASALANGQMGIFAKDRDISLDPTAAIVGDFRILLARDTNGNNTIDTIQKQAGQYIQFNNIKKITNLGYRNPRPQVVSLNPKILFEPSSLVDGVCEKEFSISIDFFNARIKRIQGKHQFSKYYNYYNELMILDNTGAANVDGTRLHIMQELIKLINSDEDNLVIAQLVEITGPLGLGAYTSLSITDIPLFLADPVNVARIPRIRILLTTNPLAISRFVGINTKYYKERETSIDVFYKEGFAPTSKVTVARNVVYERWNGYDVNEREYQAEGWEESSYRTSTVTGISRNRDSYVNIATKYHAYTIEYSFKSSAGWGEYEHNLATEIYVPITSTLLKASLDALLIATAASTGLTFLTEIAETLNVIPPIVVPLVDDETTFENKVTTFTPIDKTFTEATANNGTIDNSLIIELENGNFIPTTAGGQTITISAENQKNIPSGLTLVATIGTSPNANKLTLTFTGAATAHEAVNSVDNIEVIVPKGNVEGRLTDLVISGVKITFTGT